MVFVMYPVNARKENGMRKQRPWTCNDGNKAVTKQASGNGAYRYCCHAFAHFQVVCCCCGKALRFAKSQVDAVYLSLDVF